LKSAIADSNPLISCRTSVTLTLLLTLLIAGKINAANVGDNRDHHDQFDQGKAAARVRWRVGEF
jgi:hypothetical protein